MNERQKRLIEVYEHLRRHFDIHTKTGFAEAIQYGRTSLSAAMNGDEKYLTGSLFKNICAAFPGVFNLDYLMTGEGTLLSMSDHEPEQQERADTSPTDEMSANLLEIYARMIRGVDDLRMQLKEELAEVQSVKSELLQARDDFRYATRLLSQALSRINNSSDTTIGIAADDGDN